MDRVIEQKTWNNKRITILVVSVTIVLLISASFYFTSGGPKLNVNSERLTISEVKKGPFIEFIPVNGVVLPLTTIYLDAIEGGRVEELFVEDGTMMKRGEPILKLTNTDLELSLANQETSVFNLLTQMQISRNAARQNTIMKLNQETEVDNTFREADRIYQMNKTLYEGGAISMQEFKQSENNFQAALKKKKLTAEILKEDSVSTRQEMSQAEESYKRTQQSLQIMRRKVEDLIVRAPIDGQLTSLDAEIGQSKNKGDRLGQIDVISGFKVRADIDEHYISRIYTGLTGEFTFNGSTYKLRIHKVYTQVNNGRFQVDMIFDGTVAAEIRRGQTLQIRLALSNETQALLLARGGFFQQTGGNWVFKVSENGKTAYRVNIELGRQNPEYYEVLSGLQPGDRVITSGYDNYDNSEELILKEENK